MTKLFIDVDDTILAQCLGHSYDLRPAVITQLSILSQLFNCYWATHWNKADLYSMLASVSANHKVFNIHYLDWRKVDPTNKAPGIVGEGSDFYWLEDPLSTGSLELLEQKDLLDQYIPVEPHGLWGFTRACQSLFNKAAISDSEIKKAGGQPSWFKEPLGLTFDWSYY